ncbi:DTW domain containing protein [Entamoeba nuttalli P19]|uniref:tRNA-uridine aminocarboxypropyltransferase 1 n=1 Tax=Entamoeba nuttalli (strain P19) TaxID=1076696 RepID=K2GQ01_ENTNP|nr:DTW domain containing protein [Entamoeba nuttalli P19]EKE37003.1 DTW domain containing protein [Entamoeba nuttalli P19]|eukprot:XP_008860656.1 DTW domain containing protein [Entamoeba nuttalli P19]
MAAEFFNKLKLSSKEPLEKADKGGRITCPLCHKKMKYYCYYCRRGLIPELPQVNLPIKLDIIHHPTEKVAKSTALTACIVAKDDTQWIEFPNEIPQYDPNETILLFPSPDAKRLSDFDDLKKYKRMVCIESVWYKANAVLNHPNIKNLPKAIICAEETLFWRYQNISNTNLSTIEAIYYFYRDYYTCMNGKYNGECDDLLYFFTHIYHRVQDFYNEHPDKTFIHKDGYIQYKTPELEKQKEEEYKKREEMIESKKQSKAQKNN